MADRRKEAMEALRRAAPDGWQECGIYRQWELAYRDPKSKNLLRLDALGDRSVGAVEVSGLGCTITCGPEAATKAVAHVVSWMRRQG